MKEFSQKHSLIKTDNGGIHGKTSYVRFKFKGGPEEAERLFKIIEKALKDG